MGNVQGRVMETGDSKKYKISFTGIFQRKKRGCLGSKSSHLCCQVGPFAPILEELGNTPKNVFSKFDKVEDNETENL